MATARLRLTLGYLAVLALMAGLLNLAFYILLQRVQASAVPLVRVAPLPLHGQPNAIAAIVPWLVVADFGALLLGALGAYTLAGRTLRPIMAARVRQDRFAVAASHELRTPLTVLLGTLDAALLRPRTPAEYEETVRRAQVEAEHLVILLDDVLALAHAENGAGSLDAEPLDLDAVAEAAARDLRAAATGKQQTLALSLEGPMPARGDARALRQAIADLLDNAVTYTPVGGTIHLVGRRGRHHALLVVRDTGLGIADEHLPHLFEPFYRADQARSNGAGHVGLGLVRAARIARGHGGCLTIESQVGVGTAATLMLPLDTTPYGAERRAGAISAVNASH